MLCSAFKEPHWKPLLRTSLELVQRKVLDRTVVVSLIRYLLPSGVVGSVFVIMNLANQYLLTQVALAVYHLSETHRELAGLFDQSDLMLFGTTACLLGL